MRYLNGLTLPQNGINRVSEELKFQNFLGEDGIEPRLLKTAPGYNMDIVNSNCLIAFNPVSVA